MNKKYKITYKFIFQKKSKLWVKIKQFYVVRGLREIHTGCAIILKINTSCKVYYFKSSIIIILCLAIKPFTIRKGQRVEADRFQAYENI